MKKILAVLVIFSCFAALSLPALAEKREDSGNKHKWNLSGDVMPVPPYGQSDIPGSDKASKIDLESEHGKSCVEGDMKGLNPNTTYTVFLSNPYTKYKATGWNVTGSYVINVEYLGTNYAEDLMLTQSGSSVTGTLALVGGGSDFTLDTGNVSGNTLNLEGFFVSNPGLRVHLTGTIASDGSVSGTWMDVLGGSRTGTWNTTSGMAIMTHTGDTYWTGMLPGVSTFTFTTDMKGKGKWKYCFTNNVPTKFSVWINGNAGTILISDNLKFKMEKEDKKGRD